MTRAVRGQWVHFYQNIDTVKVHQIRIFSFQIDPNGSQMKILSQACKTVKKDRTN